MINKEDVKKLKKRIEKILKKYGLLKKRRKRRTGRRKRLKELLTESFEDYEIQREPMTTVDVVDIFGDVDLIDKYSKSVAYYIDKTKFFPDKRDFQYAGIDNERKFITKVMITSTSVFAFMFLLNLVSGDVLGGITQGLMFSLMTFLAGVYYPKLKLLFFRGEIKLQVLFTMLYIIATIRSGMSLQEAIEGVARNKEFGIPSMEFRTILRDINIGGFSFQEAIERAIERTKIPLMETLYQQLLIALNKGNVDILLERLYEEVIRDTKSKIDMSKFMIQNLGNLVFGVGMIMPFSGMLQQAFAGGGGFEGIINAIDLIMLKLGPMATMVFAIFVKMKIE